MRRSLTLLTILLAPLMAVLAARQAPEPDGAERVYADFCAGCHGAALGGAKAASLLDDEWTHGGDDASLATSIADGRLVAGMPAFRGALSDAQIDALVRYIREQAARARTSRAALASPATDVVVRSEKHAFRIETVVSGLDTPWGLQFLPDGRMLLTERPGRLRIADGGRLLPPVEGTPAVWERQDGGLLDVALHPDYATNGWIYLGYSAPGPAETSETTVVRGRIRDGRWVDQELIYQPPADLFSPDNSHYGLRFTFDRAGHLIFSIGDRGRQDDAQVLSNPHGKIFRVTDDGRVPAGNPFAGRSGALPQIWSYGHRNPQGFAWHPVTGDLWSSEHGPRGGDELNVIEAGRNYGWPAVTHGINYDGTPVSDRTGAEGMEPPAVHWTPSIAVCGIAFYTGDRFPGWKHDLFVGALGFEELRRVEIDGRRVGRQEVLFKGIGRVRTVVTGPDGLIYVALNSYTAPGRIVRLVPADPPTAARNR